jgi:thioredoxin-like negative regulator of GroEL
MRDRQMGHTDEANRSGVTLLAFCAPWCAHCLYHRRAFERACAALGDEVAYGWIDIEAAPGVIDRYGIEAIPMILLLQGGYECMRLVGVQPREAILESVRALQARVRGSKSACGGKSRAAAKH